MLWIRRWRPLFRCKAILDAIARHRRTSWHGSRGKLQSSHRAHGLRLWGLVPSLWCLAGAKSWPWFQLRRPSIAWANCLRPNWWCGHRRIKYWNQWYRLVRGGPSCLALLELFGTACHPKPRSSLESHGTHQTKACQFPRRAQSKARWCCRVSRPIRYWGRPIRCHSGWVWRWTKSPLRKCHPSLVTGVWGCPYRPKRGVKPHRQRLLVRRRCISHLLHESRRGRRIWHHKGCQWQVYAFSAPKIVFPYTVGLGRWITRYGASCLPNTAYMCFSTIPCRLKLGKGGIWKYFLCHFYTALQHGWLCGKNGFELTICFVKISENKL